MGLPEHDLQVVAPDGVPAFDINDDNQVGWSAEISLDVQWAHAVAPGATILLVEAKSNEDTDILSATKYAVDHNLGDVISQSFGENESCVDPNLLKAQHAVFQAANAKGITLIASAGDSGAAELNCDGTNYLQAASSPASDPLVLGVGGTQLHASPVVISSTPPLTVLDPGGVYQCENESGMTVAFERGRRWLTARSTRAHPIRPPSVCPMVLAACLMWPITRQLTVALSSTGALVLYQWLPREHHSGHLPLRWHERGLAAVGRHRRTGQPDGRPSPWLPAGQPLPHWEEAQAEQ